MFPSLTFWIYLDLSSDDADVSDVTAEEVYVIHVENKEGKFALSIVVVKVGVRFRFSKTLPKSTVLYQALGACLRPYKAFF